MSTFREVDQAAASKAVFWAKLNDERESQCPVRDTSEMVALRAAFKAAERAWDKNARDGKGGWKKPGSLLSVAPGRAIAIEPNPTGLDRTLSKGKVVTIPDYEDSVDFAVEHALPVLEATEKQRTAAAVFEERTGEIVPVEIYAKLKERNAELLRGSHVAAQKLQRAGEAGYASGEYAMFLYDPVSRSISPEFGRHAIEQPRFRRCNFIPVIAQQKRRAIVKVLEYWLERHPHARFWTFTSGQRCTLPELRRRIQDLHRLISRLNAECFMKEAGASIVFRATETGSLTDDEGNDRKNENGEWLFHPHSHCIVEFKKGYISPARFKALLRHVHAFMGDNWNDAGQINTVRECAKYPMKPQDVERLSDEEAKQLLHALQRLHLVQPLGSVKALKEELIEAGHTLTLKRTSDGVKLTRLPNWNRHPSKPKKTEIEKMEEKILSYDDKDRDGGPKLIAMLAPGPYFDRIMRPGVLVTAKQFGPSEMAEIDKMPQVAAMVEIATPSYLAAQQLVRAEAADPIKVHTYPVTVRPSPSDDNAQSEFYRLVASQLSPSPNRSEKAHWDSAI